jgi:hypothetical protein
MRIPFEAVALACPRGVADVAGTPGIERYAPSWAVRAALASVCLLAACSNTNPPSSLHGTSSPDLIVDAAHNGHVPGLWFLAPFVDVTVAPVFQTFAVGAQPTVTVFDLGTSGAAPGTLVASYAQRSGPRYHNGDGTFVSEYVRFHAAGGACDASDDDGDSDNQPYYYVRIDSDELSFVTGHFYRVIVTAPVNGFARQLGLADIEVFKDAKTARRLDNPQLDVPLVHGHGVRVKFRIDTSALNPCLNVSTGGLTTCAPGTCQATSACTGDGAGGCATTNKPASTSCDDGNAATWADACDGKGACAGKPFTACAAGQYVAAAGTATSDQVCTACAVGAFSTSANATSCTAFTTCSIGNYVSSAGSASNNQTCAACAAGTFSTSANATSCTPFTTCSVGNYVSSAGSASNNQTCAACAAGTFSSSANAISCAPFTTCGIGSYVSSAGSASSDRSCAACAPGTISTSPNAAACVQDPCLVNNGGCSKSPLVACTQQGGVATCGSCPAGFAGDGVTCTPLDPCLTNHGGCSTAPLVSCTNHAGVASCGACPAGYAGNGVICTDTNECASGANNCSPDATCTNTPGSFACTCNPGFTGDGVTCTAPPLVPAICACDATWDINSAVTFDGSCSSGSIAKFEWDFAYDGTVFSPSVDTFGFAITGKTVTKQAGFDHYSADTLGVPNPNAPIVVALRVTDNTPPALGGPLTSVATCHVVVKPAPHCPHVFAGGPYTALAGQPVAFDATASFDIDHDPVTYRWDFQGTALFADATGPLATHTFNTPGVFTIDVQGTDHPSLNVVPTRFSDCAVTAQTTVVVTPPGPVAVPGGPYVVATGQSILLDGSRSSDSAGLSLSYAWDLSGDSLFKDSTAIQPVFTPAIGAAPGTTYPVCLKVVDANQSNIACTTVAVIARVVPPVCQLVAPTVVEPCGVPVTITVDGSRSYDGNGLNSPLAYQWASSCAAVFDNSSAAVTQLAFYPAPGVCPAACTANLSVSTGGGRYVSSCDVSVSFDPCLTNNGGCSTAPRVACTSNKGVASCGACPAGYTGNGVTCTDINECANGANNCSPYAACTNTPGSFTCTCGPGLTGDGVTCAAPPAALTAAICDCNATWGINSPVTIDGSCSSGNVAKFEWDFAYNGSAFSPSTDAFGFALTGKTVTKQDGFDHYTADYAGIPNGSPYNVVALRVTDNTPASRGGPLTSITTCNVITKPAPHCPYVVSGGPYVAVAGKPVTFSAAASVDVDGDPITYQWDFHGAGAFTDASGVSVTQTFASPGIYSVAVQGTDHPAWNPNTNLSAYPDCAVASQTTVVVATAGPVAVAGGPYLVVRGQSSQLDGSGSSTPSGRALAYAWDFSGDRLFKDSTAVKPFFSVVSSVAAGTSVPVCLKVSDGSRSDIACTTVAVVNALVPPVCSLVAPSVVASCSGGMPTITVDGLRSYDGNGFNDPLAYQWSTTCAAVFDSPSAGVSHLAFSTAAGVCPANCTATLSVTDTLHPSLVSSCDVTIGFTP